MANQTDPLAGLYDEQDELAGLYEETPQKEEPPKDLVSEELRALGHEPDTSEELERLANLGTEQALKQFGKGAYVGITGGLAERKPDFWKKALMGPLGFLPSVKTPQTVPGIVGQITGESFPLSKLHKFYKGKSVNIASKSPFFKQSLSSLAKLTSSGLTGATYAGVTTAAKGEMPSTEEIAKHGALWIALDAALGTAGLAGRFTKNLLSKSNKLKQPPHKVVNDVMNQLRDEGVDFSQPERVGAKALAVLEEMPNQAKKTELPEVKPISPVETTAKDLASKSVGQQQFDTLAESEIPLAEKYKPVTLTFKEATDDLATSSIEERINETFPAKIREQELGQQMQESLENVREEMADTYNPLYEEAEDAAQFINITPVNVTRKASQILENLESIKTRPKGYQNVINTIESAFQDVGFQIERNAEGRFVKAIAVEPTISASRLITLGKRLNEIVNYDVLEPTIQDQLKPIVNAVKQEIRNALSKNESALNAWESAERLFGDTAQRYNKDVIRKIRSSEAPEKIVSEITSPSSLEALKDILKPEQMQAVERQILEQLKESNHLQAQKLFNELRPHLSPEAQNLGERIVNSKLPISASAKRKQIMNEMFHDLSDAMVTGTRPKKTLDLWKTPEGRKLIKIGLRDNKNKDQIIKYLENQSFYDFASIFVGKDGKIDFDKFKDLLKNKEFLNNLKDIGGQEAVDFFKNVDQRLKHFENQLVQNAKQQKIPLVFEDIIYPPQAKKPSAGISKKAPKTDWGSERLKKMAAKDYPLQVKLNAALDFLGLPAKAILSMLGVLKFGLPSSGAAYIAYKILYKLATNGNVRNALKKAFNKSNDLTQFINAINHVSEMTEEST